MIHTEWVEHKDSDLDVEQLNERGIGSDRVLKRQEKERNRRSRENKKELEGGLRDVAGRVWRHGQQRRSWPQTVRERERDRITEKTEREREKRGRERQS